MALAPPPKLQPRPRLGDLLIRDGKITQEQLDEAMKDRDALGGRLGRHLIDLGFLDEASLLDTLSRQMQIPIVDLDEPGAIEPGCERYARGDLADRWGFVPMQFVERRQILVIAVSDPDPKLIRNIEESIGRRVDVRIASSSAIERAQHRMFRATADAAAAAPPQAMKGLQLARATLKPGPKIESPWSEPPKPKEPVSLWTDPTLPKVPDGPWSDPTLPKPADWSTPATPKPPPVKLRAAAPALPIEPDLEMPRESSVPHPTPAPVVAAPVLTPPPPEKSVETALIVGLREQVKRLEDALAAQSRVMRALVEVLDEKGVVTRAELGRKHQGNGK